MNHADDHLPTPEEARAALAPALYEHHARVREAMHGLRPSPPQVLLLEAGLEEERFSMALWYAALLNCQEQASPCLECPACLQIGAEVFADLIVLDGRDSSIKIDDVRELRALVGEAPRGGGIRVVVLAEAQALSVQAANALLKSLEEPRPGTVFLLLTPQRERLLPTLVSRGWVLTLAWPDASAPLPEAMRPWLNALARFLRNGQGWFELTATKGAVDTPTALQVVLALQKTLAGSIVGRGSGELSATVDVWSPAQRFMARDLLTNAQESLNQTINPALVLDWLATKLFLVHHTKR